VKLAARRAAIRLHVSSPPLVACQLSKTMSGSEPLPDPEPRIELRLEADPEPVEGDPEPANDPWRALFVEFKDRDEKMMKDYQEEIDTLLVFVRRLTCFFAHGLTPLIHRPASSRQC
jgi:hypothetical protein